MLVTRFPPSEVAAKIAVSLGIGLLLGIEREWSTKDLGARTFALTALFGTLAALFLLIQIVATLSERYLGKLGFLAASVIGGLVSSASTSAAAANMAMHGQTQPALAGDSVVLASVTSALINLPTIYRTVKNRTLSRRVTSLTVFVILIGLAFLGVQEYAGFFRRWL